MVVSCLSRLKTEKGEKRAFPRIFKKKREPGAAGGGPQPLGGKRKAK